MRAGLAPGAGPVLRDYQQEAVDRLLDEIAQHRHAMLVLPTGSGKTVVAGQVVSEVVGRGGRVVAVAHRRELVSQFSKKLHAAGVIDHGIIQANFAMRLAEPVQVCSIQTLHARTVLRKRIQPPPADLIIIDEAHRSRAKTYRTPDLTGVRIEHGDYAEGQLAERMNTQQLVGDVVEHWHRLGDRRRTVVFASGVRH